jgi:magnesium and cobalt transporter
MKQIARREVESPSFFESFLRRVRELALGDSSSGDLRETIEGLIEETEAEAGASFSSEERALVRNALSFGELRVDDVMVPRADIKGIEAGARLAEAVAALQAAGHSRLVVYRNTLDDVLGVVHIKDLLPFWGDGAEFALERVVRTVLVVPPSMRVIELLLEMRQSRNHVAVVVDEYGGIDGLVTIGDLVEELVGEFQDEHDRSSTPELIANADGTLDADGRIDLEEVEKRLGMPLLDEDERDEADTLAGLIFGLVDRVPARGEVVQHPSGYAFEVLDADPRRIKRVRIRPPSGDEALGRQAESDG